MDKLGIDLPSMIFQIINFALLVYILNKFLYKPVLRAIAQKKKELEEIKAGKDALAAQQKKFEAEREKIIKTAQNERDEIIKVAKREMQKQKKQVLAEAEKRSQEIIAKGKKEFESEKKNFERDFEKKVAAQAFEVSEKVLGDLVSADVRKKSVKKAVASLKN